MKIIGIENNYRKHNNEAITTLKEKSVPFVFSKLDSSLLKDGKPFFIPDFATRCTAQLSLVVRISRLGKCITPKFAHRYYDALTTGVDFTAVEQMNQCRSNGLPYDLWKGFDGSSAVGHFCLMENFTDSQFLRLEVNGKEVQYIDVKQMIWSIDELVAYISKYCTLRQGDLLFAAQSVLPLSATINDKYVGYVGTEKVMEFNVK